MRTVTIALPFPHALLLTVPPRGIEQGIDVTTMLRQGWSGVLTFGGTAALAQELSKISVKGSTDPRTDPRTVRAESLGRANNDLHTYVYGKAKANVVSLYIDRQLLHGDDEGEYYRALGAIAEEIKQHLRGIDEAVLVNSRQHVLFSREATTGLNGLAG